jgi:hypothetical protein
MNKKLGGCFAEASRETLQASLAAKRLSETKASVQNFMLANDAQMQSV